MATHSAVSTETYREKALRKFKQQPLVPVGATSPIYVRFEGPWLWAG